MFGLGLRQVVILLIVAVVVFAATQFIPAYYSAILFEDAVRQEVKFAVTTRKTTEKVRENIVVEAHKQSIPLTARDVQITRRGPAFTVEIDYRIPVNLRFFVPQMNRHVTESGEIFENDRN